MEDGVGYIIWPITVQYNPVLYNTVQDSSV